ncbi:MAG: FKBP-type peptidyl-prolyl cis-trans isomerase N-terminal domain-containing protein, partial [Planctomycetota bacterium]
MKTRIYIVMAVLCCLAVMSVYAAQEGAKEAASTPRLQGQAKSGQELALKTEQDKVSYIIGTQIGRNFKSQEVEVNLEALVWGLKDMLGGKELALSQEEMQRIYASF